MNPLEEYDQSLREANLRAQEQQTQNIQQEVMMQQQDKSMIQEQLDLGEELERIDYLLRGYTYEKDEQTGENKWVKPQSNEMVILSEYGIHLVRNTIAWYLNKNTLLSNYDENTILSKMEDFANDLNDTIFMEYEKVFQYPTFEECKEILMDRIKKRVNERMFTHQLLDKESSEEVVNKEVMREVILNNGSTILRNTVGREDIKEIIQSNEELLAHFEVAITTELDKIKAQLVKNKLKRFMLILRVIQDVIHSAYNRAYMGQERKTLREHIHISETKGGNNIQPQSKPSLFSHFKRR